MNIEPEDVLYYSRRVTEEREAAKRARHPGAAAAHEGLAAHYVAILERAYHKSVRVLPAEPPASETNLRISNG
jgi:hypothetical protein